jgi:hypothetical protein
MGTVMISSISVPFCSTQLVKLIHDEIEVNDEAVDERQGEREA